jgi:hypothetical protein
VRTHFPITWITALLLAACGAPDAPPVAERPSLTTAEESASEEAAPDGAVVVAVTVSDGEVQTASQRVDVALGSPVRVEVSADTADEVHVHGYDVTAPVAPDAPAVVEFPADIPGVFEVELEGAGLALVELRVQ